MTKMNVIFALLFSCLLITVRSAGTLVLTTSDVTTTSVFPVTTQQGSTTAVTGATQSTTMTAPADGTGNAYTVRWTGGLALNQVYTMASGTGTPAATGAVIVVTLGPQVSLAVTNTPSASQTAGTAQASAAAVLATSTTCGNYFIDCVAGTLTFQMYNAATASISCVVTINQVAAVAGILRYVTASAPASPYATVTSAVTTANGATGAVTTICGTGTADTNTLLYFISTYGSATGTAQTTAYNQVRAAAAAGNIASNTGYYTANLQPSVSATLNAPSTQAASLSTVSKSANKVILASGLFTTAIATLFGLAL